MRKSTISLLFGVLLAGSAVAAEPVNNLQDYAGQYVLADGRILTVAEADGKLTAAIAARPGALGSTRLGRGREVALKADGLDRFKSTSTPLQISFRQNAVGDIAQVDVNEHAVALRAVAAR